MKAVLKFDLEDKFDQEAHMRAVRSSDLALALYEMRETIHRWDKTEVLPEDVINFIRNEFNNVLDHYDINLETLLS